jgi:hypothetical protein
MSDAAPAFPYSATLATPLRAASERRFAGLHAAMGWSGGRTCEVTASGSFTRKLAADVLRSLNKRSDA